LLDDVIVREWKCEKRAHCRSAREVLTNRRELMGRGEVDVVLMVAGKAANTVRVAIK
jgi:hypothetical protein